MKKLVSFIALLMVSAISLQAEVPSRKYQIGIETVTVFDYKQSLKKTGEELPVFPPRTSAALIVQLVEEGSRAAQAGLKEFDLIRFVNGKLIRSADAADKLLKKVNYTDELKLGVVRQSDGRWEPIQIKLEPLSERDYFRTSLIKHSGIDDEYRSCTIVRHRVPPISKYSHNNIQLYFREVSNQPMKLYFRMGMLVPGKSDEGPFVIQTEKGTYKVVKETALKVPDRRTQDFEKKVAELTKLRDAAETKRKEAVKKSNAAAKAFQNEFKDFKLDPSRKDEEYKKRLKRKLEAVRKSEKLAKEAYDAGLKFLEVNGAHQKLLKASIEYSEQRLKKLKEEANQEGARIHARINELPADQATLIAQGANKIQSGVLPDEAEIELIEKLCFRTVDLEKMKANQGWKWYDAPVKKAERPMIEEIISSPKVMVSFDNDPSKTFEVTPEQKQQMKAVLAIYEDSGGKVGE